nr:unnamed protein product [Gossypium raimondii]
MKKWKGQKREGGKKREAKRDAVTAMEKSPVRNQIRLRLRGRSAEMKRKGRTKKSATNRNGSSIIEYFLTKIKESPSELEGLKNKERIKVNTGGIQYRRSIGTWFPALFSFSVKELLTEVKQLMILSSFTRICHLKL